MTKTRQSTEGQKTIDALLRLEELVEQLEADRSLGDHAFWLHIDRDLVEMANRMLEQMTTAIELEREAPAGVCYLGAET